MFFFGFITCLGIKQLLKLSFQNFAVLLFLFGLKIRTFTISFFCIESLLICWQFKSLSFKALSYECHSSKNMPGG